MLAANRRVVTMRKGLRDDMQLTSGKNASPRRSGLEAPPRVWFDRKSTQKHAGVYSAQPTAISHIATGRFARRMNREQLRVDMKRRRNASWIRYDHGFWTKKIPRRAKMRARSRGGQLLRSVTSTYGYFPMLPFIL
jgi:hypothetical protein